MREVETKILEIDVDNVRRKLKKLGAKKVFDGPIHMISFDYPDEKLEKQGVFLRVRKVGDQCEVCFKGKKERKGGIKSREETQVLTSDYDTTVKIFEKLGFQRFFEGGKHRESYKLGRISFEIDTYAEFPAYLEIEAPSEKEVKEWVKKMGFSMEEACNLTAHQLGLFYRKKRKVIRKI